MKTGGIAPTDLEVLRQVNGIPVMIEKHYTINDLSELLQTSLSKTRLMVKDEPGVLRILPNAPVGRKRTPREKIMYRIPQSVVERILRRSANPARA
jgi:hypothetical protein